MPKSHTSIEVTGEFIASENPTTLAYDVFFVLKPVVPLIHLCGPKAT
jgi:hypothetical protein